jgi:post-segregation antitoxin (ccd killing protein)
MSANAPRELTERQRRWLDENREAIASINAFIGCGTGHIRRVG